MKYVLLISALSLSSLTFAQKAKLSEAQKAMSSFSSAKETDETGRLLHMTKAIGAIDEAARHEQTKDDPKTYYLKARIYTAAMNVPNFNSEDRLIEANKALEKALSLNSKIANDSDYPITAINLSYVNFQNGIAEFNNQNYLVAKDYFANVSKFVGEQPSAKFSEVYSGIDTTRAEAQYFQGKAEMNETNYTEAIPLLEKAAKSPYLNQKDVLTDLIYALEQTGNKAKQLEYISQARKRFPNDANIEAFEINYFIENKQYDDLIVRLEQSMQKDPKNPKHPFNLGIVYSSKASPSDGNTPQDATALEKKAEEYYLKALELAGDNPEYNQSLGIHYFNMGVDAHNKARVLNNGNDKEKAMATQLQTMRNNYYKKALPILEKTRGLYEAKGKFAGEEKQNYANTLEALKRIYATTNDVKKYQEVQKAIEELK